MTEPVFSADGAEPLEAEDARAVISVSGKTAAGRTGLSNVRLACLAIDTFGSLAGFGLCAIGFLIAILCLIGGPGAGLASERSWARAGVESMIVLLAFVLGGWALAVFSRLLTAVVREQFERAARESNRASARASRVIALLERIASSIEVRIASVATTPTSTPTHERARAMAEIVRATRARDWLDAETRLSAFEEAFPDDSELSFLKDELLQARHGMVRDGLARLDAARQVNDPDQVLEIYSEVVSSLDEPRRAALDKDLGGWFLTLIHRRLRTGKVQADVVRLAERFAESFATTVEGASVRASLPTLRRSVGLCPRCAQPYTGVADACPNCKKAAVQTHAPSSTAEPVDDEIEPMP